MRDLHEGVAELFAEYGSASYAKDLLDAGGFNFYVRRKHVTRAPAAPRPKMHGPARAPWGTPKINAKRAKAMLDAGATHNEVLRTMKCSPSGLRYALARLT